MAKISNLKQELIGNFEYHYYPVSESHKKMLFELDIASLIIKLKRDESLYEQKIINF